MFDEFDPEVNNIIHNGRENLSLEERNNLILNNRRLVTFIANKFVDTGIEMEELVSVGNLGLIYAIDTFDSDKGVRLSTYAAQQIKYAIMRFISSCKYISQEISLYTPIPTSVGNSDPEDESTYFDILRTDDTKLYEDMERRMIIELIKKLLVNFTPRERNIMNLRYGLDGSNEFLTQREVGRMLGVSSSRISDKERHVLSKLRKELIDDYKDYKDY